MSRIIIAAQSLTELIAAFIVAAGRTASAGDVAATHAAVERSLPYLMERGNWWIEKKDCVSCHRVSFQVWAHAEALVRGFDVDEQKLGELTEWSLQALAKEDDEGVATGLRNPDGAAQMLAAIKQYPNREQQPADFTSLVEWIAETQNQDGSWKPAGQLPSQKRLLFPPCGISLWPRKQESMTTPLPGQRRT